MSNIKTCGDCFFFSSRRRHTRSLCDWSSDVCSSDLDKTEGDWRITRRVTEVPIRFAGFNLGVYERSRVSRNGYTVEVCANRAVEKSLEHRPRQPAGTPQAGVKPATQEARVPLDPLARLE